MATKKKGFFFGVHFTLRGKLPRKRQRYFCHKCGVSFSQTPKFTYAKDLTDHLAKQYFEGKSSYRDMAREFEINRNVINGWVKKYLTNCKTSIEIAKELKPQWTGYLTADGKVIRFRGSKGCLYIGVDNCGDIVHILVADSFENKTYWSQFFKELKIEIKYNLLALVSDGNADILAACRLYFGVFSHQTCLHHFLKRIDRIFGYLTVKRNRLKSIEFAAEIKFRNQIKCLLRQETSGEFIKCYGLLIKQFRKKYRSQYCYKMIKLIDDNLFYITAHYFDDNISKTNNLAETTIKQYERRLKTMEGFQTSTTSKNFLNMFTVFLRCKPYTDCKKQNRYKNGKSRLQLAGVDTENIDWLDFCQKSK